MTDQSIHDRPTHHFHGGAAAPDVQEVLTAAERASINRFIQGAGGALRDLETDAVYSGEVICGWLRSTLQLADTLNAHIAEVKRLELALASEHAEVVAAQQRTRDLNGSLMAKQARNTQELEQRLGSALEPVRASKLPLMGEPDGQWVLIDAATGHSIAKGQAQWQIATALMFHTVRADGLVHVVRYVDRLPVQPIELDGDDDWDDIDDD